MTKSQRALIAAKSYALEPHFGYSSTTLPTISNLARRLKVSVSLVSRARFVLAHGTPELIAAVERGQIGVCPAVTAAATGKRWAA